MAIEPGTKLGPYEIGPLLGAGGMGEVYRAEDTRLARTVAIKVLPAHSSNHPGLRDRLEREARAVSALQHPHICTLFDVGNEDGSTFLVMEHLEGETLSDRLARGALGLDEALRFGAQIADALGAAHEKGIVHRDLKPGNIMLTGSGAKVLDFGLAKWERIDGGESADSNSPTEAKPLTEEGSLLGTVPYMAPEQLEGKEVDARSDIFALGAVLYEMVTGRRAFEGISQASIIGAIMNSTPRPVRELKPQSPPLLDRTISKCLAKARRERFQSAHDVVTAIEWASEPPEETRPEGRVSRVRGRLGWIAAIALAILAAILVGGNRSTDEATPTFRMVVNLPEGHELQGFSSHAVDVSPDGQRIAFTANDPTKGRGRLFVRNIDSFESIPLTEQTNSISQPVFSPDGRDIAFTSVFGLYKVSVDAGAPVMIGRLDEQPIGLTWMEDGSFIVGTVEGLFRIPQPGAAAEQLTHIEHGGRGHWTPHGLPNDRGVIFTVASANPSVAVLPHGANEPRILTQGENAFYLESGHLVFALRESGAILAAPFDLEALELTGTPFAISDVLARDDGSRSSLYAPIAAGRRGTLAYVIDDNAPTTTVWVSRDGLVTPAVREGFHVVRLSPDGSRFAADDARTDRMWVYDIVRGTRILLDDAPGSIPAWTADGTEIAFTRDRDMYITSVDGSARPRLLLGRAGAQSPFSWSHDQRYLAFTDRVGDDSTGSDVMILSRGGEVSAFADSPANEHAPTFSPDGKSIAYLSDETGRLEVYVKPFPGPGPRIPISTNGGKAPVWSRDGTELFYREGSAMMAVAVTHEPTFAASAPTLLFDGPYQADGTGHPSYDVAPDGRFLMMRSEPGRLNQIHVVVNLGAELAQKDLN